MIKRAQYTYQEVGGSKLSYDSTTIVFTVYIYTVIWIPNDEFQKKKSKVKSYDSQL